ncbi:MAG: Kae1-like domain-containing protein [Candidatus Malihini olakiniferum]
MGDLADSDVEQKYQNAITLFENIYRFTPMMIAADAHPSYISYQLGHQCAENTGIACHEVLHHHAYIATCLAEHGWPRNTYPVVSLMLDEIGYGENSQWWGGECLLVDYRSCSHRGGLPPPYCQAWIITGIFSFASVACVCLSRCFGEKYGRIGTAGCA